MPLTTHDPTFERFLEAAKSLGLSRRAQAELLGLGHGAFYRRLNVGRLKDSERATAELLPLALRRVVELFGDEERARKWLIFPNAALGGIRPVELLSSPEGLEEVLDTCAAATFAFY